MVVRAVHRLPLRDVVSHGDGPQASCLATQLKEEHRRTIATNSRFSNAFDAIHDTIGHVPGKSLITADAMWRSPQERPTKEAEVMLTDEVTAQANMVVGALPATEKHMAEIRARQLEDDVCRQVMCYCAEGWPIHPSLPSVLRSYWQVQNELTIQNGLLLKGALYRIQILCRRCTFWCYPAGLTIADPPG